MTDPVFVQSKKLFDNEALVVYDAHLMIHYLLDISNLLLRMPFSTLNLAFRLQRVIMKHFSSRLF